ncbi:MAG: helix-turn-helix transcriptional regulator [Verrucomicrobiaceae bacterium]|nr:helix-turn-helix transcriptional regulator [Verrucomicrobiaceae bacterium]
MPKKLTSQLRPTVFVSQDYKYICDTCNSLKGGIKRKTIDWVGIKRGLYPGTMFDSDELQGLRLLAYWDAKKSQDWRLDFHRNEGLEIGFVESGSTEFSTDTKSQKYVSIKREHVAVTKPWQEHAIGSPVLKACKMYFAIIDFGVRKPNQQWKWPSWILLSEEDKKDFANYMQKSDKAVFKSTPELRSAFSRIGKILASKGRLDISKIALLLNVIVFELLDVFRNDSTDYSKSSPTENVVRCFLEQLPNYCNEPWTVDLMAEDCGLKPTRFSYYCRALTNLSPIEFLNNVRLKRAKEMIEDSECDKNLLEIALDCGFSSNQYFSTIFHKKYGKPPSYFFAKRQ